MTTRTNTDYTFNIDGIDFRGRVCMNASHADTDEMLWNTFCFLREKVKTHWGRTLYMMRYRDRGCRTWQFSLVLGRWLSRDKVTRFPAEIVGSGIAYVSLVQDLNRKEMRLVLQGMIAGLS